MCGLFGMMGPGIIKVDFEAIIHLGYISLARGTDAAGLFETNTKWGNKKSKWSADEMQKVNGDWSYLVWQINKDRKSGLLCDINHDLVMAHVRWATRGNNDEANAHPFQPGNLVGFHNGTLVDKKYNLVHNKTDSEAMFEDIAERGLIEVLPHLDPKSAYAIQMYDKASKTVYFARNEMRPLYFAINEDRAVLYWASEAHFLHCALGRLGIKYRVFSLRPNIIVAVQPKDIRPNQDKILNIIYSKENVEKLIEKIVTHQLDKKKEESVVEPPAPKIFVPAQHSTSVRIYNVKEKEDSKVEDLFVKCSCGRHRLNAFDSHHIKRTGRYADALASPLKYDKTTNTFECSFTNTEGVVQ